VLGTVLDAHGGGIPHASVSLEDLDTGTAQATVTDANGNYQFLEVRVGRYHIVAEMAGFKKAVTPTFKADVGARQRVDVTLQVGDVKETVQVEASASPLEPDSSDRGQVVNQQSIVDLPLNGRSNAALTLLSPGVRRRTVSRSGNLPSTSAACAASSTTSFSMEWITTPTAPRTRAFPTR
jgi:hypothetical protein